MMLQLLDNIVRKGIVCIDMAREQERSIARLFQMVLRRTKTSSLCAAALSFQAMSALPLKADIAGTEQLCTPRFLLAPTRQARACSVPSGCLIAAATFVTETSVGCVSECTSI
jgi:hypothetical protein